MTSVDNINQAQPAITQSEDEIDLRQVAAALKRQKKLIGGITTTIVLLSAFYAFTRKPVWEGQFQIVLEARFRRRTSPTSCK